MCGIVGYTGHRPARPLLLEGLSALEYRGYDSAGITVGHADGTVDTVRSVGNLAALREAVAERVPAGAGAGTLEDDPTAGLGHTRDQALYGRAVIAVVLDRVHHPPAGFPGNMLQRMDQWQGELALLDIEPAASSVIPELRLDFSRAHHAMTSIARGRPGRRRSLPRSSRRTTIAWIELGVPSRSFAISRIEGP